jgi:recombination protein RecA
MSSLQDSLIKTFGEGIIVDGDKVHDESSNLVHVSPKMDLLFGGGLSSGLITIAGPPKSGKTLLSLHIAGKAQQLGRPAFYISVEGREKKRDFESIKCLDASKIKIVRSFKNEETGESRILTAEEFLSTTEKIIHAAPNSVIIIDSLSQLVSAAELDKDFGIRDRASASVLLSQFFRRISNVIRVNNIILVGIQHVISNVSGYGKKYIISGGIKALYSSDTAIEVKSVKLIGTNKEDKDGDIGPAIGQEVTWQLNWSQNSPPGRVVTSIVTYGKGIDEVAELCQVATDCMLIKKAASWYSLLFLSEENPPKLQGERAVVDFIESNPEAKAKLEKMVNELIYAK